MKFLLTLSLALVSLGLMANEPGTTDMDDALQQAIEDQNEAESAMKTELEEIEDTTDSNKEEQSKEPN
ncbi:hypothetical protein [Methylophaga frappieri]|nr:hypothetical protein [Methylophaga frappieri]